MASPNTQSMLDFIRASMRAPGRLPVPDNQDARMKSASVCVSDEKIKDLPKAVVEDIKPLMDCKPSNTVVLLRMAVSDLIPKADATNLSVAQKTIRDKMASDLGPIGEGKEAIDKFEARRAKYVDEHRDECIDRAGSKYILVLNDRIIDGHHFLAACQEFGVTNSLQVVDLTPVRFQ